MQTQDPNNPDHPGEEEFFDEEFDNFDDFSNEAPLEDLASESADVEVMSDDLDENFGDENWNEDEVVAASETGKKGFAASGLKNLSFNTMVIGIAVIVGLGVLAYQVLKTQSVAVPGGDRFQSALNFTGSHEGPVLGQAPEDVPQAPSQPAGSQVDDTGFMNNPDMLNEAESTAQNTPPMPSPISNDVDDQGIIQQAPQEAALTPMPAAPAVEFEESQPVPRGPDNIAAQTSAAVPETAGNVQADSGSSAPQPVLTAVSQNEMPEMSQATNAMQTQPAAISASQADELLDRLDALATRLDTLDEKISAVKSSGDAKLATLEQKISSLAEQRPAVSASAKTNADEKAPAPQKKSQAPAPKKQASKPAPSPAQKSTAVTWELRAAQPGRAWVSRKGEREMQTVQPGDNLAGIGQITRIEYAGNGWLVVGTQGQITQ